MTDLQESDFYIAKAECANCKKSYSFECKKGVLIHSEKCANCGCYTLFPENYFEEVYNK